MTCSHRWSIGVAAVVLLAAPALMARPRTPGLPPAADVLAPGLSELGSDVVFAASKRLQRTQHAPGIVWIFTEEEIQRRGFRSVTEVLASLPGIEMVDTGRQKYLLFRGAPFTLLALLDGVSLVNHVDQRVDLERLVPIELVRKLEIVLSPGGVLWGAHSLYGVVNIITRGGEALRRQRVLATGGSWSTLRGAYDVSTAWRDVEVRGFASLETGRQGTRRVEDSMFYPGTFGNSGDTQDETNLSVNLHGSVRWRGLSLAALALLVDDHAYPFSELSGALAPRGFNSRIESPTVLVTADYRRAWRAGAVTGDVHAETSLFDQRYFNRVHLFPPYSDHPLGVFHENHADHQLRVGGLVESRARFAWLDGLLGVETFHAWLSGLEHYGWNNGQVETVTLLPAASSTTGSLFGQVDASPHRDVNLAVGTRVNLSDSYRAAVVLHGHVVYEPIDRLVLKVNYSEGFRPPSFEQRFLDAPYQKGSVDLLAERTRVVEAQADLGFDLPRGWRGQVVAGYAFGRFQDLVGTLQQPVPPHVFQNLADESTHSVDLQLRLEHERLALVAAYVHHEPVADDGAEPRLDFAHDRLRAWVKVQLFEPLSVVVDYGLTGRRRIRDYLDPATLQPADFALAAYHELAATVRYRVWRTPFFITGTLRNLLAQRYSHAPPYTHLAEMYRGPFPQPYGVNGFITLEYVGSL